MKRDGCLNSEKQSSHVFSSYDAMRCEAVNALVFLEFDLIFFSLLLISKTGVWIHLTDDG